MSHAFGPGNAFGAFAPSAVARHPRRVNSSGSQKDDSAQPSSTTEQVTASTVSSAAPNLPRSFSSILAPSTAPISHAKRLEQEHERSALKKPFVYSREFVLSLYDDDKARRRPIELIEHELATKENADRPWALKEYRSGEKELFATSIHPPNTRTRASHPQLHRADSANPLASTASPAGTLELASLGTLPRDRDRVAAVAQGTPTRSAATPLASGAGTSPSSVDKEAALGSARRSARTGLERSTSGSFGITGGVLGGLGAGGASPASSAATRAREPSSGSTGKDVWQPGGRWRRAGESEVEGDKPIGFGPRRYPTNDSFLATDAFLDPAANASSEPNGIDSSAANVPAAWNDEESSAKRREASTEAEPETVEVKLQHQDAQVTDADLAHHATSILGSLALDSDPTDDPLLRQSQTSSHSAPSAAQSQQQPSSAPPGLAAPSSSLQDVSWQYRDPSGQVQGPFAPSMMVDWHQQGFFSLDLRVKRVGELDFESIEHLIRRSGDRETFFLTASLQPVTSLPPPVPHGVNSGAAGWPLAQPSPVVEQFAAQRTFGNASPFSEPFGAASPSLTHQTSLYGLGSRSTSQTLDPWATSTSALGGATSNVSTASTWGFGVTPTNGFAQAQSPFQQQQQQQPQQTNVDLFRENPFGAFGHPQQQAQQQQQVAQQQSQQQMFYEQPQQSHEWNRLNGLPGAAAVASPAAQPSWTSLLPQRSLELDARSPAPSPLVSAAPSPIGPPAAQQHVVEKLGAAPKPTRAVAAPSPVVETAAAGSARASAPVSPWAAVPQSVEKVELSSKTSATDKILREAQEAGATPPPPPGPAVEATSEVPSAAPKPVVVAPWIKDDVPTGPSLREIQEVEAREAEKRKQTARIQAAQANIQAAQRAAALEAAEQLPPSANWASPTAAKGGALTPSAGPAAAAATVSGGGSPAAVPWSKPKTTSTSGKTLKEIQEEEERRKKAAVVAQQVAAGSTPSSSTLAAGRGYAAVSSKPPAPWTTIAVKPAAQAQVQAAKPIIPGLPASALKMPIKGASSVASPTPILSTPTKSASPAMMRTASIGASASGTSTPSRSTPVRPATSTSTTTTISYDVDHPPPPSGEFLGWTRSALKGLVVPSLDEFMHMLLSFPLEASEDVLEIISDSVYANSSTLDGRRFANEFTTRRKTDIAQRYPGMLSASSMMMMRKSTMTTTPMTMMGGIGATKPSSMAEALKAPTATMPNGGSKEWSVKVAGGKKKKTTGTK